MTEDGVILDEGELLYCSLEKIHQFFYVTLSFPLAVTKMPSFSDEHFDDKIPEGYDSEWESEESGEENEEAPSTSIASKSPSQPSKSTKETGEVRLTSIIASKSPSQPSKSTKVTGEFPSTSIATKSRIQASSNPNKENEVALSTIATPAIISHVVPNLSHPIGPLIPANRPPPGTPIRRLNIPKNV